MVGSRVFLWLTLPSSFGWPCARPLYQHRAFWRHDFLSLVLLLDNLALCECVRSHCKDFTLAGFPSRYAFAIRICSRLTFDSARDPFDSAHFSSARYEGTRHRHTMCCHLRSHIKSIPQTFLRSRPAGRLHTFVLSIRSILPITSKPSLLPASYTRMMMGIPYGLLS